MSGKLKIPPLPKKYHEYDSIQAEKFIQANKKTNTNHGDKQLNEAKKDGIYKIRKD